MKLLLDTHLLIWTVSGSERLSQEARTLLDDRDNELFFSPISFWEIAIKRGLDRPDFLFDGQLLRDSLLEKGFWEITLTTDHAMGVGSLPLLHKDPFDRLLIAQALIEGVTLLTSDRMVSQYRGSVRLV